jgi:hypothetical protein
VKLHARYNDITVSKSLDGVDLNGIREEDDGELSGYWKFDGEGTALPYGALQVNFPAMQPDKLASNI